MNSDKSQKWLARVEYDLQTAEAMLSSGRYIYAVFMCQQSIEKTFKALISHNGNEVLPLHNLRRLAESSGSINLLDEKQLVKLDFLSQYYINASYKEDIVELSKGVTKEFSEDMIKFIKEIVQWIMQKMK